jgi:hypothetical protein
MLISDDVLETGDVLFRGLLLLFEFLEVGEEEVDLLLEGELGLGGEGLIGAPCVFYLDELGLVELEGFLHVLEVALEVECLGHHGLLLIGFVCNFLLDVQQFLEEVITLPVEFIVEFEQLLLMLLNFEVEGVRELLVLLFEELQVAGELLDLCGALFEVLDFAVLLLDDGNGHALDLLDDVPEFLVLLEQVGLLFPLMFWVGSSIGVEELFAELDDFLLFF